MQTNSTTQFIVDKHKYAYHSSHISVALGQHQVAEMNHSHNLSKHNVTVAKITGSEKLRPHQTVSEE
jgi:hypothetical protein